MDWLWLVAILVFIVAAMLVPRWRRTGERDQRASQDDGRVLRLRVGQLLMLRTEVGGYGRGTVVRVIAKSSPPEDEPLVEVLEVVNGEYRQTGARFSVARDDLASSLPERSLRY